jgi:hypothetical protein
MGDNPDATPFPDPGAFRYESGRWLDYEVRRFLRFSDCAAIGAGLRPQQHQLLLQVAGAAESEAVTVEVGSFGSQIDPAGHQRLHEIVVLQFLADGGEIFLA